MRILAVITALAVLLGGCRPAQENSYTGTASDGQHDPTVPPC